jgi:hypothetical protein
MIWGRVETEKVRVYRCSAKLGGKLEAPPCSCGRVFAEDVEARVWDKVVSFFRQPEVVEAEVRRILDDMPTDTVESDLENIRTDLAKGEKLYGKMYAKLTQALVDDDDMLATRLEADCKRLAEEIKAYQNVAGQLEAKLAAKERTAEIAREFAGYCRKVSDAFDTVDIPFERKVQMLSTVRVKVFAHSDGTLKLQTNLDALVEVASPKSLVSSQIGTGAGRRRRSGG